MSIESYTSYVQGKKGLQTIYKKRNNRINWVMVSMVVSSAVDHRFEPPVSQTRDKHAALKRKSKDSMLQKQESVEQQVFLQNVVSVN